MPARLWPNPPRGIVGESGSVRKRVYVLKARATYSKADWNLSCHPPASRTGMGRLGDGPRERLRGRNLLKKA
ncbi:hypothetical protein NDU88_006940 [Pleurodeles waltl]|uniref:Uncharacterized protein n=1 Tax=Pleurodeles waltl TaxID=8319 RepID=A0AAV7QML4_PLEWA|nr:hypothetical protein NDU88_006940 [Pleurodeles waltl]